MYATNNILSYNEHDTFVRSLFLNHSLRLFCGLKLFIFGQGETLGNQQENIP